MDKICDLNKCTGCMTCMNICPTDAISSVLDNTGKIIPHINQEQCIDCNMCKKSCPINNRLKELAKRFVLNVMQYGLAMKV